MIFLKAKVLLPFLLFVYILFPDIAISQDYDEWKNRYKEEFQQFKDERDTEFLEMLQEAWEEMEAYYSGDDFKEPKPDLIPVADNQEIEDNTGVPADKSNTVRTNLSKLNFEAEEFAGTLEKIESADLPSGALRSNLNYYNVEIEYYHHPGEVVQLKGSPSRQTLMDYWAQMSKTNYEMFVNRIKEIENQLNLNDWGTLMTVDQLGKDLHPVSRNNASLFVWFMMTKLGYDVKVGYTNDHVYLMFPSNRKWFNVKFLSFGGDRYYVVQLDENPENISSLRTYSGSYPDSDKVLSVDIDKMPRIPLGKKSKEISFNWRNEEYRFDVSLNENLVDYFKYFPNTDLDIYINAAHNKTTANALLKHLGEIVTGKSQSEAVNIILSFVQTAFEYETDDEQFGRQKYMLPDEILYYPYSDCDDRTILFTFLTKELLGIDVIGLRYPNHIATAVKLDTFSGGDYVTVEGERYTIADPTYINATLGMTMRKYRNHSPELVRFD